MAELTIRPDEIRDAGELALPEADAAPEIHKRELDMAVMLVDNLTATFDPERYHDEYREALMAVVESKLNDQPITAPAAPEPSKVTDLMAALKASVEAAKSAGVAARGDTAKTATAARKRAAPAEPARRRKAS